MLADDLARPQISDPGLLGATAVINAIEAAAYFAGDLGVVIWLGLEGVRIWLEHGTGPAAAGPGDPRCLRRDGCAR